MRGRLIVVEGMDGCGKSTLCHSLASALDAAWLSTPMAGQGELRMAAERAYGYSADARAAYYASAVLAAADAFTAARERGQDVVVDRWWPSTQIAARLRGARIDLAWLAEALPRADATLLLDAPDRVRARRIWGRGPSTKDDSDSLARVRSAATRQMYHALESDPRLGRVCRLDASKSAAQVLRQALAALSLSPPLDRAA